METKKDFVGHELKVGDVVVFIKPEKRDLLKGTIKSLGEKQATISYVKEVRNYNRYNGQIATQTLNAQTRQQYDRLMKLIEPKNVMVETVNTLRSIQSEKAHVDPAWLKKALGLESDGKVF